MENQLIQVIVSVVGALVVAAITLAIGFKGMLKMLEKRLNGGCEAVDVVPRAEIDIKIKEVWEAHHGHMQICRGDFEEIKVTGATTLTEVKNINKRLDRMEKNGGIK